jgi:hypothetical protein
MYFRITSYQILVIFKNVNFTFKEKTEGRVHKSKFKWTLSNILEIDDSIDFMARFLIIYIEVPRKSDVVFNNLYFGVQ